MKKSLALSLVFLGALLLPVSMACASGFAIVEQSVSGLGTSFASGAAAAEDASIVYFNPAGMTLIKGQQVVAGAHVIVPSAKFNVTSATSPGVAINPIFATIPGENDVNGGVTGVVPNLYYVNNPGNGWAFGLGINAPFGLATDYGKNWIGRYHAVESDVKTININPSVAYQVTENLSLGAGISAQYIDVTLSSMVNGGLAAFAATGGAIGTPNSTSNDIFVENKADDWSYGYNLGAIYKFSEGSRIGVSYRSKIKQELTGTTNTTVPTSVAILAGAFADQNVSGNINLPASASVSVYHEVNNKLALLADVSWTDWSSFDVLTLNFEGTGGLGGKASSTTVENWKDSWRYSLGAIYQYNDALKLRGGVAFDQTPIPDAAHRTPRIPGEDRTWVSVGAGYKFSDRISGDFAYAHLFVPNGDVNASLANNTSAGSLVGSTKNSVDIVSVQLSYNF
ncbi:OmpP1/FadL family transporter [Geopsychrobacter electrodiphilus]|uniref:OmpP1/FadL family transporter n=1 Tax=Geopsychrobacter electrodiphilus TaxID=225196 RepID=UPI000375E5D6|nr:outer membrane protein transport protein [Geopsychrobacter electrodiphilus]